MLITRGRRRGREIRLEGGGPGRLDRIGRWLGLAGVLGVCWAARAVAQTFEPPDVPASQPAATLRSAHELYVEGYYARAVEQFEAVVAGEGNSLPAVLGIVRCHLMTGEYDKADQRLGKVLARGARSADWHALAAELDAARGRYESAVEHARTAVGLAKTHYRARYLLGELLETVGRRDDAIEAYKWFDTVVTRTFPPTAEAVTATAQGFMRYNTLTEHASVSDRTIYVLNELLQVAYTRMDRTYWPARIAAAELLLSKYNLEEATEDYQAALLINNNLPGAYVGLGHIALGRMDFDETDRRVEAALETNPRSVPALVLRAAQKIAERRYDEASAAARQALEINPHDARALGFAAGAAAAVHDRATVAAMCERAGASGVRAAQFHAVMGDVLLGMHQYADSETHYVKAVELDPTDANVRCELGTLYMLWGDEAKARVVLEAAWALDQFNDRTKNTLELLESMDAFATLETEHFIIRYEAERDAILPRYVGRFLEEIYDEVCADYATYPKVKTIIEVFPTAAAFGVRISGKPWILTVGACTGRLIALASPRVDPQTTGSYNYADVLRHEFTHTVTLAATNNRIPTWFTEGLAVSQEDNPRDFGWCELLADRARRDELFTLENVDWAFVRPQKPGDRQAGYAQSEWMCEYLVERCGYDVLNRMLVDYGAGLTQHEVFVRQTGITPEEFDAAFREWAREDVASWGFSLDPPESVTLVRALALVESGDAAVLGRLAKAEYDYENFDRALTAARKALVIDENEKNALEVFVKVLQHMSHEQRGVGVEKLEDEAIPALTRLVKIDPRGWTAPKMLARIMLRRDQPDKAMDHLLSLQRNCPMDPLSYSGLAGIYLDRNQPELALPQLLELARLNEHDASVPTRLGSIYAERGKLSESRYWYLRSLHIDPFQPYAHAELARVLMRLGQTDAAIEEYQVLCELEPTSAQRFADTAFALQKTGDAAKAKEYARKAVQLDPASPARTLAD